MPRLSCWSCGRQIYTVAPLEALFAEERRCPRCGAFLRGGAARDRAPDATIGARTRPHDPGPPRPTPTPDATHAQTRADRERAEGSRHGGARRDRDGCGRERAPARRSPSLRRRGSGRRGRPPEPSIRPAARATGRSDPAMPDPGPSRLRYSPTCGSAFLGFGLIAGSIARAVRLEPGGRRLDDGRLVAERRGPDARRPPTASSTSRRRRPSPPSPTPTSSSWPRRRPPAWRSSTRWRVRGATALPPTAVVTDVASTKTRDPRPGRCRRPAVRRRPPDGRARDHGLRGGGRATCSSIGRGSSSAVRTPSPTDVGRVADLATACAARVVLLDAAAHDRAVAAISHLPLSSRPRSPRASPA